MYVYIHVVMDSDLCRVLSRVWQLSFSILPPSPAAEPVASPTEPWTGERRREGHFIAGPFLHTILYMYMYMYIVYTVHVYIHVHVRIHKPR